ncbi:hypothetical protein BWQ96_04218 [Gracilariopsis chorda]|uniref:Uncharacterized protein n=1 Tax=Gracilariopsis chorda TaxID=448386 RepID=A0A2V3IVD2_9FLOR|nr:hypothetical protein BWQ96_04218 [Gracilariopsis chorda]|eukprot:PXF46043.1 hypothetical protein BWQ96_04218 [Gracilariopsis chorda]
MDAPPSSLPPQPLPLQLDLLNYHARRASRHAPDRAAALFQRALCINSADGRAWLGLARLQIAAGKPDAARETFRAAMRACPKNAHLLQAWGVLEQRQHAPTRARGLFRAAVRAHPSHAPSWVALALWYQRHAHDLTTARECLQRATEAQPHNYYAWQVWAQLESSVGNISKARHFFAQSLNVNARNAATYVAWACFEAAQNNLDMAVRMFEKAHKVSPRNVRAYVAHAAVAERAGSRKRAKELLTTALSIRPDQPGPRQMMALLQFREGRIQDARDHFRGALEVDRTHGATWHAWACVELSCGNVQRARELFQEAIWATPQSEHAVRTWHAWASLEMQERQFSAARRYFAHAMEIDSNSVPILNGMAKLEAMTGDMSRARQLLEQSIRLKPNLKSTWKLYEDLELAYGSVYRAQLVYERCVVFMRQVGERLVVSEALPGDFKAGGMWIDALELSPSESAFDKIDEKDDRGAKLGFGGKKSNSSVRRKSSHMRGLLPKPVMRDPAA